MSSLHPLTSVSHPSPARKRVSPGLLNVALFAGPTAWFVQLNISVLLGMNRCSGQREDAASPLVTSLLLVLGLAALLIVSLGLWAATRSWNLSRSEAAGGHHSALTSNTGIFACFRARRSAF